MVVGLLALAAMVCAFTVRGESRWVTATAIAMSAGLASALSLNGVPLLPLIAGVPLVVIAVWLMRSRRPIGKHALIMLGAVVAAVVAAYAQLYGSLIFGEALMNAAGYSFPVDGLPFLLGSILFGTVAAIIIASRLIPREPIPDTALEAVHVG